MDSKTKQQTVQMGTGKITVSEITMCGVFAAVTFLLTRYIQVQIIPAKGGLVHLGNVPMFFAAAFFGKSGGRVPDNAGDSAFFALFFNPLGIGDGGNNDNGILHKTLKAFPPAYCCFCRI